MLTKIKLTDMKPFFILIVMSSMLMMACEKAIEEKKEDLVVTAMTSGTWYVQEFQENGSGVTGMFSGYDFKFYADGKVEGIKGAAKQTGTWAGDASAMTITSSFPASGDTLSKFNAVWQITGNSWDYVKATTNVSGTTRYLHLKKR
jgi:hypothetical protein